jgi:3-hydroxybutyryl-CoA dehydratase
MAAARDRKPFMQADNSAILRFESLTAGQAFTVSERYEEAEMRAFEALSGDTSPLHVDPAAASQYGYPDRLLYGFLLLTLLSRLVGTKLHHAVCASVSVDFVSPGFPGEKIDLVATVDLVHEAFRSVVFKVRFKRGDDVIARGRLTVVFPQ